MPLAPTPKKVCLICRTRYPENYPACPACPVAKSDDSTDSGSGDEIVISANDLPSAATDEASAFAMFGEIHLCGGCFHLPVCSVGMATATNASNGWFSTVLDCTNFAVDESIQGSSVKD